MGSGARDPAVVRERAGASSRPKERWPQGRALHDTVRCTTPWIALTAPPTRTPPSPAPAGAQPEAPGPPGGPGPLRPTTHTNAPRQRASSRRRRRRPGAACGPAAAHPTQQQRHGARSPSLHGGARHALPQLWPGGRTAHHAGAQRHPGARPRHPAGARHPSRQVRPRTTIPLALCIWKQQHARVSACAALTVPLALRPRTIASLPCRSQVGGPEAARPPGRALAHPRRAQGGRSPRRHLHHLLHHPQQAGARRAAVSARQRWGPAGHAPPAAPAAAALTPPALRRHAAGGAGALELTRGTWGPGGGGGARGGGALLRFATL